MNKNKFKKNFLILLTLILSMTLQPAWSKSKDKVKETVSVDSTVVSSEADSQSGVSSKKSKKNKEKKEIVAVETVKVEAENDVVQPVKKVQPKQKTVKAVVQPNVDAEASTVDSVQKKDAGDDEQKLQNEDSTATEVKDSTVSADTDNKNTVVEDQMINSMLQSFPPKTDFIANEDKKSGDTLVVHPQANFKASNPVNANQADSTKNMFIKMLAMTLIMAAVVFVLAYVWKLIQNKQNKLFQGQRMGIKVLSQQFIGNKSKILIIETLGKRYLIGATESNIGLLADIDFLGENVPSEGRSDDKTGSESGHKNGRILSAKEVPDDNVENVNDDENRNFEQVLMVDLSGIRTSAAGTMRDKSENKTEIKLSPSAQIRERLKDLKKMG